MSEHIPLASLASERRRQCRVELSAYQSWLAVVTPARWVMVGGTAVLATIAAGVTQVPQWTTWTWQSVAGPAGLAAAILSVLHTALNCDAHQAECRRLVRVYRTLDHKYEALRAVPQNRWERRMKVLEREFLKARVDASAEPAGPFRARAERRYARVADAEF